MKGRDRTHCVNGHPFTEANTERHVVKAVLADGTPTFYQGRRCRACHRIGRLIHYYTKEAPQRMSRDELESMVRTVEAEMRGVLW